MAAIDEPDSYVFVRGAPKAAPSEVNAAWHKVLKGKALQHHYLGQALAATQAALAQMEARISGGLTPGMTKGGKPVAGRGKN